MKKRMIRIMSIMLACFAAFAAGCNDGAGSVKDSSSMEESTALGSSEDTSSSEEDSSSEDSSAEDSSSGDKEDELYFPEYDPDAAPTEKITVQPAQIASGTAQTFRVALDKDGKAWCWGDNRYGQIGNGEETTTEYDATAFTPQAAQTDARFVSVSAGARHALAIDKDGGLWGWGTFDSPTSESIWGEETFTTPQRFLTGKQCVYAEAGTYCSFIIDTAGRLWAWGRNSYGCLGDGTTNDADTPIWVVTDKRFVSVSSCSSVTYGIDTDGHLWGWGSSSYGFGDGTTGTHLPPVAIMPEKKFAQVSTNYSRTYALDENGNLWGWGSNPKGQLGDGTKETQTAAVPIMAGKYFTYVESSNSNTYAIDVQGKLWAWGNNSKLLNMKYYPQHVPFDGKIVQVSEGLALDENGELWTWGSNGNGEVGDGVTQNILTPTHVFTDMRFSKIASRRTAAYAVDTQGKLWMWNSNGIKQMIPEKKFKEISISGVGLAIDTDGGLWVWGSNRVGQFGDGTTDDKEGPVQVMPDRKFAKISAGSDYCHAIDIYGNLWAWGGNGEGEFGGAQGLGSNIIAQTTPAQVRAGTKFVEVASFNDSGAFAIDTDGDLWGWGALSGKFGTRYTPVLITGEMKFSSLALNMMKPAGNAAIDTEGKLCVWGGSSKIETYALTPTKILTEKTFSCVSAGERHVLAVDTDGKLCVWGFNAYGQLGLGTKGDIVKSSLYRMLMPEKRFTYAFAGNDHSYAIYIEGKLWAWGSNDSRLLNGVSMQFFPKKISLA